MIKLGTEKYSTESLQVLRENLKCYPEDGELWWSSFGWNRNFGKPVGSIGGDGYYEFNFKPFNKSYRYKAHVVLWALYNNNWPTKTLDHINRDKRDNRISNLRLVTPSENLFNANRRKNSKNKYKGVYTYKAYNMWTATINKDGRTYSLGYFKTEDEALEARLIKERELYGEILKGNST